MEPNYGGIYKAEVVAIEDDQRRHRVRVHVKTVHAPNRTATSCPWAETCVHGSKGAGSFFGYKKGDLVWVMFDNGNPDSPVIVGAQNSASLGVSDEPIDKQADYEEGLKRWSHSDRRGNLVEHSEVGDELYVRIKSGGAEVRVTQMGDEVIISSPTGKVRVDALQAQVNAGNVTVKSAVVDIEAQDFNSLGVDNGKALLSSNDRVEINAQDNRLGVTGEVAIGGAARRFLGVAIPPGLIPGVNTTPKQTPRMKVRGRTIDIGGGVAGALPTPLACGTGTPPLPTDPSYDAQMDFDGAAPLLPTVTINIRAQSRININSGGSTYIQAATTLDIHALGIVSLSAPIVSVNADGNLTLSASGVVNLKGTADLNIESLGIVEIKGALGVKIGAEI